MLSHVVNIISCMGFSAKPLITLMALVAALQLLVLSAQWITWEN